MHLRALLTAAFLLLPRAQAAAQDASVPVVVMNEYIVARGAQYRTVRTVGVATCIAVALFDPRQQIGALAHVSPTAKVGPSIDKVVKALVGGRASVQNLQAQLIGGWRTAPDGSLGFVSTSPIILSEIHAALRRHRIPVVREETLVEVGLNRPGAVAVRNLSFDLTTGRLEDFTPAGTSQENIDRAAMAAEFDRTQLMQPHPLSLP